MVKRIVAGASGGWAGIVGLGWWLAHARIAMCNKASTYTAEANCEVRATAARDQVLTSGLTVALVAAIVAAVAWSILRSRDGRGPALIQARSIRPERPSQAQRAALVKHPLNPLERHPRVRWILGAGLALALIQVLWVWAATDTVPPAAAADYSADNYEAAADNLEMMADPLAEDTNLPGEASAEQDAPTSDKLGAATLLDEAADELERAAQEPEPEPDEAEASEDYPPVESQTPATE